MRCTTARASAWVATTVRASASAPPPPPPPPSFSRWGGVFGGSTRATAWARATPRAPRAPRAHSLNTSAHGARGRGSGARGAAFMGAHTGVRAESFVVPNPSAAICADIRKNAPGVLVFECTSHTLLAKLQDPTSDYYATLTEAGWPGHFSYAWLDYCGALDSRPGASASTLAALRAGSHRHPCALRASCQTSTVRGTWRAASTFRPLSGRRREACVYDRGGRAHARARLTLPATCGCRPAEEGRHRLAAGRP